MILKLSWSPCCMCMDMISHSSAISQCRWLLLHVRTLHSSHTIPQPQRTAPAAIHPEPPSYSSVSSVKGR
jgi:hypothetical protein